MLHALIDFTFRPSFHSPRKSLIRVTPVYQHIMVCSRHWNHLDIVTQMVSVTILLTQGHLLCTPKLLPDRVFLVTSNNQKHRWIDYRFSCAEFIIFRFCRIALFTDSFVSAVRLPGRRVCNWETMTVTDVKNKIGNLGWL